MFSMCSELTPRARIPDTRIPQFMQPCLGLGLVNVGRPIYNQWLLITNVAKYQRFCWSINNHPDGSST